LLIQELKLTVPEQVSISTCGSMNIHMSPGWNFFERHKARNNESLALKTLEIVCIPFDVVFNVGRVEEGEKGRSVRSFLQAQPLGMITDQ